MMKLFFTCCISSNVAFVVVIREEVRNGCWVMNTNRISWCHWMKRSVFTSAQCAADVVECKAKCTAKCPYRPYLGCVFDEETKRMSSLYFYHLQRT